MIYAMSLIYARWVDFSFHMGTLGSMLIVCGLLSISLTFLLRSSLSIALAILDPLPRNQSIAFAHFTICLVSHSCPLNQHTLCLPSYRCVISRKPILYLCTDTPFSA